MSRINCVSRNFFVVSNPIMRVLSELTKRVIALFKNFLLEISSDFQKCQKLFSSQKENLTETEKKLKKETHLLQTINKEKLNQINNFQRFIESDPTLQKVFQECYAETKEDLLPPARKEKHSTEVENLIIREWNDVSMESLYLESQIIRIMEFLEKNPRFCETMSKLNEPA